MLDELYKEVWEEGSDPQSQPEAGHHQTCCSARLLTSHHLGPGDHADGADVAVTHAEENHDDDVGGVTLKQHSAHPSVAGPDVAEEEERNEDKSTKKELAQWTWEAPTILSPYYRQGKDNVTPNFARFWPLHESCEKSTEVVSDVEEEKAADRDIESAGPDRVRGHGGDNLMVRQSF